MRYRQINLDFHTSEKIDKIGEHFDRSEFQQALKMGHVDSITLFSKCHHGWGYHPSKSNDMHPGLKFDLLKAQIDAAHEIGVRTSVYISAGIDEKMSRRHPEWLIRNKDESLIGFDFNRPGFHYMCFNTPYLDYLIRQVEEVCKNYDADGLFLDITGIFPCYCQYCVRKNLELGLDPYDEKNAYGLSEKNHANLTKRVRAAADKYKKGIPLFFNSGHITRGKRDFIYMNTHLELESLPTGGWGYDHFPLSAAYARTLGMDFLGMTGKFHTTWGEFGGFKHPNALKYEAALAVANGAKMSVGDQLHPNGKMDIATYRLIGEAYKEIEMIEPWLKNAINIADIALLSLEAVENYHWSKDVNFERTQGHNTADIGCSRILLEGKYLFNVIDTEATFEDYKLIILPDKIVLDDELSDKLKKYVNNGGRILATGKSAVNARTGEFSLDFGAEFVGEAKYQPSYLYPCNDLKSLLKSAYVIYSKGYDIKNVTGEIASYRQNPYFNRSTFEFCSHCHTPNNPDDCIPASVIGKDGAYIAWEVFDDYAQKGSITVKEFICEIIDILLSDRKTLYTNLPAQGVTTLTKQNDRYINHLLYAAPVCRGKNVQIIEDLVPIYKTEVTLKINKDKVSRVYKAPQMEDIEYALENGILKYTVDKFECSQLIIIE